MSNIETYETDTIAMAEAMVEEDGPKKVSPFAAKYQSAYRAAGHPTHCGDWLAKELEGTFVGEAGFDPDHFTLLLEANDVPMVGKWADLPTSGQKGWVGRYRANGRQKLEMRVIETGVLILPAYKGSEEIILKATGKDGAEMRDWLISKAAKHHKVNAIWSLTAKGNISYPKAS